LLSSISPVPRAYESITSRLVIHAIYPLQNYTIIEAKSKLEVGILVPTSDFACPNSGELNRRGNQFPSVGHISLTLDDNGATVPALSAKRVPFVHSYNQGESSQENAGRDRNPAMKISPKVSSVVELKHRW